MSYLQLAAGIPDFLQAVISFWFRVPQASMQAAHDAWDRTATTDQGVGYWGWTTPPLAGILPLITFGSSEVSTYGPTSPSFIGIACFPRSLAGTLWPILTANLQMSTFATGQTELDTDLPRTRPDDFYIEGKLDFFETDIVPETSRAVFVAPDRWHHLLVSIDIKSCGATWSPGAGPILAQRTFTSWSDFSWAYDDKDYRGEFLSPSGGTAPDGNGVLPPTGIVTQGATNFDFGIEGATHWDAVPVSAHGNPVGIPTSAAFVDGVYPVEMSELQFFTGVTLDTSIVDNRRPFITAAGLPADPLKKPNPPPPDPLPPGWVPPLKGPRELLGKDADILLHGSGNWISGKNTGTSTTINEIGKPVPVPGEDFAPTGKIVAYSPDPSLHGPQSPPPPKPPAVLSMR